MLCVYCVTLQVYRSTEQQFSAALIRLTFFKKKKNLRERERAFRTEIHVSDISKEIQYFGIIEQRYLHQGSRVTFITPIITLKTVDANTSILRCTDTSKEATYCVLSNPIPMCKIRVLTISKACSYRIDAMPGHHGLYYF